MTVHVYHGPTITALEVTRILPRACLHPPVRHGDVLRLNARQGDVVVVIDGLFHGTAPVRHKEILHLLASGVTVVGASSMGALRAAELHPFGMVGVGEIFRAYRDGVIDADDEVTVVHTHDGSWQFCQPLVNIRHILHKAVADEVIDPDSAKVLIEHARRLHYPERSWTALRDRAVTAEQPQLAAVLERLMDRYACTAKNMDLKHHDAVEALRLVASGKLAPPDTSNWDGQPWRTTSLRHWMARYQVENIGGTAIPFLAVWQHQQLYDPTFPDRWRDHILRWVGRCSQTASGGDIEAKAISAAVAHGVTVGSLGEARLTRWLTALEISNLNEREKLLRILVRSTVLDQPSNEEEAADLLNPAVPSAHATAEAFRFNSLVAASGPRRTVHHLRSDRIRAHLAHLWGAPADDSLALTAAARDRGFSSIDGAVEVARSFYLWATRSPVPA